MNSEPAAVTTDELSQRYEDLLAGRYDCVDRIVWNGYFRLGQSPGGFREWWRRLYGSDEKLDNTHLMRMAGRFSRRLQAFVKQQGIPLRWCGVGERKHEIAEQYLSRQGGKEGSFLILISRAPAPVWEIGTGTGRPIAGKKALPYVNHYSFPILDRQWGHITIKICGHPPFTAPVLLNGHEHVACRASQAGIGFTKEGNCFTSMSDAAGLGKVADTLSEQRTIGRLSQVCERWIYTTCLCFALDTEEQRRSGFHDQYSIYQVEYSRNLLFQVGGRMEQVLQALIERTRAPFDLQRIQTILGSKRRPRYRPRKNKARGWEVAVEKPRYNLTVFKVHCGRLTLKMDTKGERTLRIEAIVHNTKQLRCGRSLEKFPEIVARLRPILERFVQTLSCVEGCFISDGTLEQLPTPSQVGRSRVAGIDCNKLRMRRVIWAVLALSPWAEGFTASDLASKVRGQNGLGESEYRPRNAAYDLKKLRGKQLVGRIGSSRRYEAAPQGLRSMTALVVLRDKVIQPLLAASCSMDPPPKTRPATALDQHYQTLRANMRDLFREVGLAA